MNDGSRIGSFIENGHFFNYTQILELESTAKANLAPRKSIRTLFNTTESENTTYTSGQTVLIDTELEKDIYLGTSYPFEPLQEGECIVHEIARQKYYLEEGDQI